MLLCMTPTIVSAVLKYNESAEVSQDAISHAPSLAEPAVGSPISHAQLINISRALKPGSNKAAKTTVKDAQGRLQTLLRGAQLYYPPRTPPPGPVSAQFGLALVLSIEQHALLTGLLGCRLQPLKH